MVESKNSIAAVYLARAAEGGDPVRRFAQSYRAHEAGVAHQLVVISKSDDQEDLATRRQTGILADLDHQSLTMADRGVDITAYLWAATQLPYDYLCFLNTFSEIRASGWLEFLYRALRAPGVGLVGASGSYESIWNSMRMISKVVWLCQHGRAKFDYRIQKQFGHELIKHAAAWMQPSRAARRAAMLRSLLFWRAPYDGASDGEFAAFWRDVTASGGSMAYFNNFPPFPNIHIRSNGFMIARKLLLDVAAAEITDKNESFLFESGRTSVTAKIRELGLASLVIGRDGKSYDIADWPFSATFRSVRQQNLLIADNQSRSYDAASAELRRVYRRMTWNHIGTSEMGSLSAMWADFALCSRPGAR